MKKQIWSEKATEKTKDRKNSANSVDRAFLPIFNIIFLRSYEKKMSAVYDTTRKEKKKEKELVDWTTRIGASVVTCENRRRELSSPVVLHVLLPLFLPPIRCGHLGAPTLLPPSRPFHPLIYSFSLPRSFSHRVCPTRM